MGVKPGTVIPDDERFSTPGRDLNYAYEPIARVRNSPRDPKEGKPTKPGKRTNHMFIGPDYSIVHPGLFPHSVDTAEFTWGTRFRHTLKLESKELLEYVKTLKNPDPDVKKAAEKENLRTAARAAKKHVLTDWLTFRWEKGWGTERFEENLSDTERNRRLAGAAFPWHDPEDAVGAAMRRKSARLLLDKQFRLLNKAHVERTRILRRGLQLGEFRTTRNDKRSLAFEIDVHNPMKGHAVPTGFDAERVMYLEVTLTDAHGRVLLRSGDRDPNGDLRDLHSSYVHANAPKTGTWLEQSSWKEAVGLPLRREDLEWRPDPFLFSLQSKFVTRNLAGDERESILPLNTSIDPLPFVRPATAANVHTGRGGGARKQFRTIPPLSHRTAGYRLEKDQLTGAMPYHVDFKLKAQMVPVNLVKKISPVGFDMNLSPKEVAQRVAFGHEVDTRGNRRGGTVLIWENTVTIAAPGDRVRHDLSPEESDVMYVAMAEYPFPHIPDEELAAREAALGSIREVKDFMIQNLGPLLPELWPGGVPEGLPLLPTGPESELFPALTETPSSPEPTDVPADVPADE